MTTPTPYDPAAEASRLGNDACPLADSDRWTICPDCAERFLRAAYARGLADGMRAAGCPDYEGDPVQRTGWCARHGVAVCGGSK